MSTPANVTVCFTCPHRSGTTCSVNHRDIAMNARDHDCPLNLFPGDRDYLRGAIGILKSIAGIGQADLRTIAARRGICRTCDRVTIALGVLRTCGECGCSLRAKTRLKSERCPLGKW